MVDGRFPTVSRERIIKVVLVNDWHAGKAERILRHADTTDLEQLKFWKIDKTSLYPGSTLCQPSAEDPTFQPLNRWWQDFPAPDGVTPWSNHDYQGATMAGGHYGDLKKKFGFIQIEFDQNDMVWPAFAVKMEQGVFGTFAPAGEGEGYFAIPLVLWAFDRECKIKLHAVTLWATSSGRSTRSSPTCGTTAS